MPRVPQFISGQGLFPEFQTTYLSARLMYIDFNVSPNISNCNQSKTKPVFPSDLLVAGAAGVLPMTPHPVTLEPACLTSASHCISLHEDFLGPLVTIVLAHEVGQMEGN